MLEVPRRLAKRPKYKGMPIPYLVIVLNGIPDFRVTDDEKWMKVAKEKRCQLCGDFLGKYMFFIGGPMTFENRLFYDPPMHEDCARFALKVCPYLARTEWEYSIRELPKGGYKVNTVNIVDRKRPDKIGLFRSLGYNIAKVFVEDKKQDGYFLLSKEFDKVEWFD